MGLHGGGRAEHVPDRLHDGHGHWKPGGMGFCLFIFQITKSSPLDTNLV